MVFASRYRRSNLAVQGGFAQALMQQFFKPHRFVPLQQPAFRPVASPIFHQTQIPQSTIETYQAPQAIVVDYFPPKSDAEEYTAPKVDKSTSMPPMVVVVDDLPMPVRLEIMQWQRRQQLMLAQVNASQPAGCNVMAWQILPVETFAGDVGRFLMMACDFYSHCFANTMLLPVMPAGAQHLNLPRHPLHATEVQKAAAKAKISQLRTRVAQEHGRISSALERGDASALFGTSTNRCNYKQELAAICKAIAVNTLGPIAVSEHAIRFGSVLNAPSGSQSR
jgi:hypothetical protein